MLKHRALSVAIACVLLALTLSFAGAWHGLGDSLAVFRSGLCFVLGALAFGVRWAPRAPLARAVLLGAAALGLASVAWHKIPVHAPGPILLYQKNMFHANEQLTELARDILSSDADFVTLQEVSIANEALLDMVFDAYPHQVLCRYSDRSGIAVLSRTARLVDGPCGQTYGMAQMQVPLAGGTYTVVSVHLSWPFPASQSAQVKDMLNDLKATSGPLLIGGDFNMVPWGRVLPRVARASGTERATPARTSFLLGSLPLAIDHVLSPEGGHAEARPLFGSDHFGILARLHGVPQNQDNAN